MLLEAIAPTSKSMRWLRVVTCAAPLLLPLTLWRAFFLGEASGHRDAFAFLPLAMIFGALTALDYLVGRDRVNVTAGECVAPRWLRALPLACVPLHLALLAWATHVFATAPFGWLGQLGWTLSMGSVSGILAINVAHELIHKPARVEQAGGGLLLASVGYATFKIEHVLGHHAWVATGRDPSSAKLGESVYAFVPRAIVLNVANAFRLQAARLRRKGIAFWSWRNELVAWSAVTGAMGLAAIAIGGVAGLAFFAGQAIVAVAHLEMVNYIEHYGLRRATDAAGRTERVTPMHSWNSSYFLSNAWLFQLQRHSDHHANAGRPYYELEHHESAPQLPGGYGAMMLVALVPPLWRRIIHPRLPQPVA
jgi:alkane 1-monooxygenase